MKIGNDNNRHEIFYNTKHTCMHITDTSSAEIYTVKTAPEIASQKAAEIAFECR